MTIDRAICHAPVFAVPSPPQYSGCSNTCPKVGTDGKVCSYSAFATHMSSAKLLLACKECISLLDCAYLIVVYFTRELLYRQCSFFHLHYFSHEQST